MTKYIIVLPDGTEISSGSGTNIAIASVSLTASTNSGTDLTMGSVCAAMVEVVLITPAAGLSVTAGDEIALYTADENNARVKVGLFTVEKPTRPNANRLKITAFDRIARLDRDLTQWLANLQGYPYTLPVFAEMVCAACGVSLLNPHGITNTGFAVTGCPTSSQVTGRQLMQWIAEIGGRYVTADPDGNAVFGWYSQSDIHITHSGDNYYFAGSLSYEDYETQTVDAVKILLADSEYGAVWPDSNAENPYIVSGNKILSHSITGDLYGVLQQMLLPVAMSYRPCKVSVSASCPVKAGQIVRITDKNGISFTMPVMQIARSGQRLTLESTGSAKRGSSENINNVSAKQYAQSAAKEAVSAQTQDDIFKKLTNNGETQGIFMKDGKIFLNLSFVGAGFISAETIRAGKIRSTDYQTSVLEYLYPSETLYPSGNVHPNNGEEITRGLELDFESGVIRGVFFESVTEKLEKRVTDCETVISYLEAQTKEQSAAIKELETENSTLQEKVGTLETGYAGQQKTIEDIQSYSDDLNTRIAKLENALVYPKSQNL